MPEFKDNEELDAWLKGQPRAVSVVIAARAALRVLPLQAVGFRGGNRDAVSGDDVLPVFRAVAEPWVAARYPADETKLAKAPLLESGHYEVKGGDISFGSIGSAAGHSTATGISASVSATASARANAAAATARDDAASSANAAHAASKSADGAAAARAAGKATARAAAAAAAAAVWDAVGADKETVADAAGAARAAVWDAVRADVKRIKNSMAPDELAGEPLWTDEAPSWVKSYQDELEYSLLDLDQSWVVWTGWYDARLNGRPTYPRVTAKLNKQIEIYRAKVGDKIYEKGPVAVFTEIRRLEKKILGGGEPGEKEPEAEASRRDNVPTHDDLAAERDLLNRKPFAELIAQKVHHLVTSVGEGETVSFAVHLHGPWGSGKSSILNFMRDWLTSSERGDKRWIVVEFNAWENERIDPPWWPLIKEVYEGARQQLMSFDKPRACRLWLWWCYMQIRAKWLPYVFAAGFFGVLWWLLYGAGSETADVVGQATETGDAIQPTGGESAPRPKSQTKDKATTSLYISILNFLNVAGQAGLILTTFAALVGAGRAMLFGSTRAANLYFDLSSDPLNPVTQLFNKLIKMIRRPVAIFIDDLDRCNRDYVIKLLGGIQTLFRGRDVVYVVAADRKWITTSFEKGYDEFVDPIGEDGKPLGHLFLEKIFQISVSVPDMDPDQKEQFWKKLIGDTDGTGDGNVTPEEIEKAEKDQQSHVDNILKESGTSGLDKALAVKRKGTGDGTVSEAEYRAFKKLAAMSFSTSEVAQREAEHQLTRFAKSLPDNPRFMKRMVNAYGFHRAVGILMEKNLESDWLARWTIIEQRWPALAGHLVDEPDDIAQLRKKPTKAALEKMAETLKPFAGHKDILRVIKDGGKNALTADHIRIITGGAGV